MPTPELVITNAASKTWPGGVISLRATDWIGASAGASVEIDARAVEGECVRETQQYSGHIDNGVGRNAGMAAMSDTLTIDLSLLDFTGIDQFSGNPIQTYSMYLSLLIEGDWDAQKAPYFHTPLHFDRACMLGVYGVGNYTATNDAAFPDVYLRNAAQFRMYQLFDTLFINDPTDTIHVRAFSRDITTIEFLIDQIVLVPLGNNFGYDFTSVPGGENTAGAGTPSQPVDGPDGGDDNGKFTWHPRNNLRESVGGYDDNVNSGFGGGDYQQDDSEYMLELTVADEYIMADVSNDGPQTAQHAYSIAGAYYREAEVYESDDFSRTIAPDQPWGTTAKGYVYNHSTPGSKIDYSVDGSRGKAHFGGLVPRDYEVGQFTLLGGVNGGPGMYSPNWTFSGKWEVDSGGVFWDGLTVDVPVIMGLCADPFTIGPGLAILFDVMNSQWRLAAMTHVTNTVSTDRPAYVYDAAESSGWFDVSAWFGIGVEVGFKLEVKRFVVRAKVWEASGGEPGTWDYEDFHPIFNNTVPFSSDWEAYPYSDDEFIAQRWQHTQASGNGYDEAMSPYGYFGGEDYIAQWDFYFDDLLCEFDPYGDTANVNVSLESPKGTEVGRIEVPSGAWHFIYWGRNQYATTADIGFGDTGVLDFAMKVWSDAGAAELQRAELPIIYFLGILAKIVSMNYRVADRTGVATRVLVGD